MADMFKIARDDFLYEWNNNHDEKTLEAVGEPRMNEFGEWCQDAVGDDGEGYVLVLNSDGDIELQSY